MLIIALIGATWFLSCVMAVALCVMAHRGDQLLIVSDTPTVPHPDFLVTFAEPEVALAYAPRADSAARLPTR